MTAADPQPAREADWLTWETTDIHALLGDIRTDCPTDDWWKLAMGLKTWDAKRGLPAFIACTAGPTPGLTDPPADFYAQVNPAQTRGEIDDCSLPLLAGRHFLHGLDEHDKLAMYERLLKFRQKDYLNSNLRYRILLGLSWRVRSEYLDLCENKFNDKKSQPEGNFYLEITDDVWYCAESLRAGLIEPLNRSRLKKKHGWEMPEGARGGKTAIDIYLERHGCAEIHKAVRPDIPEVVFEENGKTYLNTYQHAALAIPSEQYSPNCPEFQDGLTMASRLRSIVYYLCNAAPWQGEENINAYTRSAEILMQWIVFQVTRPTELVNWIPVLIGPQGIGKTTVSKVLLELLGIEHVQILYGLEFLKETHNAHVGTAGVLALEDADANGGKEGLQNALNPWTGAYIPIRKMRADRVTIKRRFNAIVTSNYHSCLALKDDHRRYWIIDCHNYKEDVRDYYDRNMKAGDNADMTVWLAQFHRWLEQTDGNGKRDMMKYLMDYDQLIKDEGLSVNAAVFDAEIRKGEAPGSHWKETMIWRDDGDEFNFTERVETLINNKEYASINPIFVSYTRLHGLLPEKRGIRKDLTSLGYTRLTPIAGSDSQKRFVVRMNSNYQARETVWIKKGYMGMYHSGRPLKSTRALKLLDVKTGTKKGFSLHDAIVQAIKDDRSSNISVFPAPVNG